MQSIVSLQVGRPRTLTSVAQTDGGNARAVEWKSGIVKESVAGRVWLSCINFTGDGQADLINHGGPDKAVLGYAMSHYPLWQTELSRDFRWGAFGENLTIVGATEDSVCIGDTYEVGTAVIEVSQPRQPCWKLARRWDIPDLDARVRSTGRTGWYFRVVVEGDVAAEDELRLLHRPHPTWTVARASALMNAGTAPEAELRELAQMTHLAQSWRQALQERLQRASDT